MALCLCCKLVVTLLLTVWVLLVGCNEEFHQGRKHFQLQNSTTSGLASFSSSQAGESRGYGIQQQQQQQEAYDGHKAIQQLLMTQRQRKLGESIMKTGRISGCARNPMICLDRRFKPAGPICCGSMCVDVMRDANHCGHCYHQCKYSRSCCQGRCKNLDRDSHNCGVCGRRCPDHGKCSFGLCGY